MANSYKTVKCEARFEFDQKCDFYEIRRKRRRNWWWLLLLLLPLLLLIRCEREITVITLDEEGAPVAAVATTLSYDARYLWHDGALLPVEPQLREATTGEDGKAVYRGLPCSVFSYIFAPLTQVEAVASRYPFAVASESSLFHFTRTITLTMRADTTARDVDIVMVIDNTGSMDEVHEAIKRKSLSFYSDLISYCKASGTPLRRVRMKFISYGDFIDSRVRESEIYSLPEHSSRMSTFIRSLELTGGEDDPENSLEALSLALDMPWTTSGNVQRHVVVLITDAPTLSLADRRHCEFYPDGMPESMAQLRAKWDALSPESRRLILFAPDDETWRQVMAWPQTECITAPVTTTLETEGFDPILRIISESL